jgi:hypothetical protein
LRLFVPGCVCLGERAGVQPENNGIDEGTAVATESAGQTKACATDCDCASDKCGANVVCAGDGKQPTGAGDCCPDIRTVMGALGRGDLTGAKAAFDRAGGMAACPCLADR